MKQQLPTRLSGRAPLKCRWERFGDIAHELLILTRRQQAEVGEGYGPYLPNWEQYHALDRAGSCAVWTARTPADVLAGYVIWLTTRGLHNVDTIFANADLVYLAPEWREGLRGYRFLKSAIAAVKAQEPHVIQIETNDLYRDGAVGLLLARMGFRRVGSVWQQK